MKIRFRIGKYIRRKILEWLLKDGIPYLRVGENTVDITGIDITLPSLTSDPSLAKGKIWFRGDLGQLRISPDGSNVKQVFPAYWNDIQGKPSTYPPSSHTHTRSEITDFWASPFWNNIPDKPSTFPPSAHGTSHNIGASDEIPDLTSLRSDFDSHKASKTDHVPSGKYVCSTSRSDQLPSWNDIPDKPSTYPPSSHTHTRSDITDFWSTPFWDNIPDKPSAFPPSSHTHTRSEITDFWSSPFWDNIPDKPSTFPPEAHTHTRSEITDFWSTPFWNNIPDKPSTFPPSTHASSHEPGGSDEIRGFYAPLYIQDITPQTPTKLPAYDILVNRVALLLQSYSTHIVLGIRPDDDLIPSASFTDLVGSGKSMSPAYDHNDNTYVDMGGIDLGIGEKEVDMFKWDLGSEKWGILYVKGSARRTEQSWYVSISTDDVYYTKIVEFTSSTAKEFLYFGNMRYIKITAHLGPSYSWPSTGWYEYLYSLEFYPEWSPSSYMAIRNIPTTLINLFVYGGSSQFVKLYAILPISLP